MKKMLLAALSTLGLCALSGCVAGQGPELDEEDTVSEAEDALTGWSAWSWGTTTDLVGIEIADPSNMTCFLSGVAGNLNVGDIFGGSASEPSVARVADKYPATGSYWLVAHGGADTNQTNNPVFINNPVQGRATCFFATSNRRSGSWQSTDAAYPASAPVKMADLDPNNRRQCFLHSVIGVYGSWSTASRFARVVKVTSTDATHPTTGWYVEGNLVDDDYHGSHASIGGSCVDFPAGTTFTSGSVYATSGGTTTVPIGLGMGTGIKGCALTGITGAMTVNDFSDGALITAPSTLSGDWSITIKNGKQATWACVK